MLQVLSPRKEGDVHWAMCCWVRTATWQSCKKMQLDRNISNSSKDCFCILELLCELTSLHRCEVCLGAEKQTDLGYRISVDNIYSWTLQAHSIPVRLSQMWGGTSVSHQLLVQLYCDHTHLGDTSNQNQAAFSQAKGRWQHWAIIECFKLWLVIHGCPTSGCFSPTIPRFHNMPWACCEVINRRKQGARWNDISCTPHIVLDIPRESLKAHVSTAWSEVSDSREY